MVAVNKMLDFLLQAILPSDVKPTTKMDSCEPRKANDACAEPEHVEGDDDGERADVIKITIASHERACSASLM